MLFGKKLNITEGYVDIHCHILPKVDDGPQNMETSLAMLRCAYENGTRTIVATPHYHPQKVRCSESEIYERFEALRSETLNIYPDMNILLGRELWCDSELVEKKSISGGKLNMCGGDYVLIEFDTGVQYSYLNNMIRQIQNNGIKVILAHIERYGCLFERKDRVEDLKSMGVIIQVNSLSVTGDNGKDIAKYVLKLIRENLVDIIASDAHSDRTRNTNLLKAAKVISKKFSDEVVKELFIDRPQRIIETGTWRKEDGIS